MSVLELVLDISMAILFWIQFWSIRRWIFHMKFRMIRQISVGLPALMRSSPIPDQNDLARDDPLSTSSPTLLPASAWYTQYSTGSALNSSPGEHRDDVTMDNERHTSLTHVSGVAAASLRLPPHSYSNLRFE